MPHNDDLHEVKKFFWAHRPGEHKLIDGSCDSDNDDDNANNSYNAISRVRVAMGSSKEDSNPNTREKPKLHK